MYLLFYASDSRHQQHLYTDKFFWINHWLTSTIVDLHRTYWSRTSATGDDGRRLPADCGWTAGWCWPRWTRDPRASRLRCSLCRRTVWWRCRIDELHAWELTRWYWLSIAGHTNVFNTAFRDLILARSGAVDPASSSNCDNCASCLSHVLPLIHKLLLTVNASVVVHE